MLRFIFIVLSIVSAVPAIYILWRVRWGYPASSIPRVLAYHKITNFEFGGTWVPPGRFISQVDFLLDNGFSFIDETSYLESLDGVRGISGREVLLTFDDGYREILSTAVPALEERGIPALIFIITGFAGRENRWDLHLPGRRFRHLGWDEISDLAGRGFSFGSHTCSHRDLTRLPRRVLRGELVTSKAEIEDRLGLEIRSLSYPFGLNNAVVSREAARAGYHAAFSMYPSRRNSSIDRYDLRREGVYIIDAMFNLRCKLGGGALFWVEDLKGRAINGVAVLTPLLKGDASALPEP